MLRDEILAKIQVLNTAQTSLKTNISNKGIVTAENDHIPALPDKITAIETAGYAVEGEITLVSSAHTLTISNLPIKPKEVGIVSRTLAEVTVSSTVDGYVVPSIHAIFDDNSNTKTIEECVITRSLDSVTGTWSVMFSFTEYNTANPTKIIRFQAGHIYTWLVLFHSLYSEGANV